MTMAQYRELTEAQQLALREIYERKPLEVTWDQFLAKAYRDTIMDCVMVPWAGMWLGIEPDGHTHS